MMDKFSIGVFAIILDDQNRVLLCLRTDSDLWNLPGGALETHESPWEGVVREVKEETGLNVEVTRLLGVYSKPQRDDLVFSFECKIIDGELTLNEEARDIQYFALADIPINTVPKQIERIHDYFTQGDKIIMKVQNGQSCKELMNKSKL